jgi:predicted amidohydrolase YtcJ
MIKNVIFLIFTILLFNCKHRTKLDLLVYNAKINSVDSSMTIFEAMAIDKGKIIELGNSDVLLNKYDADSILDVKGKYIYPGFIDPHCHFYGYGYGLMQCDLNNTTSWDEILEKLKFYAAKNPTGWIFGRGWDQNDWHKKDFPTNEELNKLFPNRPVMLTRVDGHAAIVNDYLLQIAGITKNTIINGGKIITTNNKPSGVLIDNAIDLIPSILNPESKTKELLKENSNLNFNDFVTKAFLGAQKNCFEVGLTSICDAGLSLAIIKKIDSLQKNGIIKMRINAMASNNKENFNYFFKNGKIEKDRLKVCAFKIYGDGALGSRGACLLKPYTDKHDQTGFLLFNKDTFVSQIKEINKHGFQACTHAIGDSANRIVLNEYAKILGKNNNKRWRIEHAQIVNPEDIIKFKNYNIIPSIQTTHATSDMYWAKDRLGEQRIEHAYAYRNLLNVTGIIANGSDFPVEHINPLFGFYAAVVRKDQKNYPDSGYYLNQALTREEALKAMTIWAAYACFEEDKKGSLEKGKYADFVILDSSLLEEKDENLFKIKVIKTFINGEKVFDSK